MKKRLDALLYERGFFSSREKARRAIMAGKVKVEGERITKPGTFIRESSHIEVERGLEFVSRGGYKLDWALKRFGIEVSDRVCLDAGAGTGGFTDCLLRKGARLVVAVDVGYGQFDYRLRKDPRVYLIERTNIRYLKKEKLPALPEIVVVDLSFISVKKVFENLENLAREDACFIILVKPQFEAGKENVGRGGIVRDRKVHLTVLRDIWSFFVERGYAVEFTYSPILGAEGNFEFFAYVRRGEGKEPPHFERLIEEAYEKVRREP